MASLPTSFDADVQTTATTVTGLLPDLTTMAEGGPLPGAVTTRFLDSLQQLRTHALAGQAAGEGDAAVLEGVITLADALETFRDRAASRKARRAPVDQDATYATLTRIADALQKVQPHLSGPSTATTAASDDGAVFDDDQPVTVAPGGDALVQSHLVYKMAVEKMEIVRTYAAGKVDAASDPLGTPEAVAELRAMAQLCAAAAQANPTSKSLATTSKVVASLTNVLFTIVNQGPPGSKKRTRAAKIARAQLPALLGAGRMQMKSVEAELAAQGALTA